MQLLSTQPFCHIFWPLKNASIVVLYNLACGITREIPLVFGLYAQNPPPFHSFCHFQSRLPIMLPRGLPRTILLWAAQHCTIMEYDGCAVLPMTPINITERSRCHSLQRSVVQLAIDSERLKSCLSRLSTMNNKRDCHSRCR